MLSFDRRHLSLEIACLTVLGAVVVGSCVLVCVWALNMHLAIAPDDAKSQLAKRPRIVSAQSVAANSDATRFGRGIPPDSNSGYRPPLLPAEAELELVPSVPAAAAAPESESLPTATPAPHVDETVPLPPSRPAEIASPTVPPVPVPRPEFGVAPHAGTALAYAAPQGGAVGETRANLSGLLSRYDRLTAVYDLTAHIVYLPDGSRLEAHSGLGDRLDDPRYVSERDRGATPPHLYELTPRESLFHGVQALRLNPVGNGDVFGRSGLLAHPYMLGPTGDSNGCVSFKDYDAFLHAFQNGQVKRLAVVARLD
jgi:hypothetical protein